MSLLWPLLVFPTASHELCRFFWFLHQAWMLGGGCSHHHPQLFFNSHVLWRCAYLCYFKIPKVTLPFPFSSSLLESQGRSNYWVNKQERVCSVAVKLWGTPPEWPIAARTLFSPAHHANQSFRGRKVVLAQGIFPTPGLTPLAWKIWLGVPKRTFMRQ